ncbi:hypothetical protein F0562_001206 [Nyssa sinensis]|uniref:Cation efflux protein cytoplasmic domain-containing protein n=1 Tax=Nyssa sinensis TaxID=561372 RepID=A0A5J5C482_9ASTE|nr:hypothetical protein F0562_001206 [Nyssa sinensis]
MMLENVNSLVGRSAAPEFLQKLTYLCWNHHKAIRHIDTVRAYTFGSHYFVEVDIILPADMPLQAADDIGESVQEKLETLPEIEQPFVHLDYEYIHKPEHAESHLYGLDISVSPPLEEEDHSTCFRNESIGEKGLHVSCEYCGHQDFEIGSVDLKDCGEWELGNPGGEKLLVFSQYLLPLKRKTTPLASETNQLGKKGLHVSCEYCGHQDFEIGSVDLKDCGEWELGNPGGSVGWPLFNVGFRCVRNELETVSLLR